MQIYQVIEKYGFFKINDSTELIIMTDSNDWDNNDWINNSMYKS